MSERPGKSPRDELVDRSSIPAREAILNVHLADELAAIAEGLSPLRSIRSLCVFGPRDIRSQVLSPEEIAVERQLQGDTRDTEAFKKWQEYMNGLSQTEIRVIRSTLLPISRQLYRFNIVPNIQDIQTRTVDDLMGLNAIAELKANFVKVIFPTQEA
jgi:hypothetical protein